MLRQQQIIFASLILFLSSCEDEPFQEDEEPQQSKEEHCEEEYFRECVYDVLENGCDPEAACSHLSDATCDRTACVLLCALKNTVDIFECYVQEYPITYCMLCNYSCIVSWQLCNERPECVPESDCYPEQCFYECGEEML